MIKLCGEDKVNYFCLLPIRRNRSMCDKNVLRQFKLPTFSAYVGSLLPLPMLEYRENSLIFWSKILIIHNPS